MSFSWSQSPAPFTYYSYPVEDPVFDYPYDITVDDHTLPHDLDVAWDNLEAASRLLERSVNVFPPLKLVVDGLICLLDLSGAVTENNEEYTRLATEFTSMAEILTRYGPTLSAEFESVSGSVARIVKLINTTYIKQLLYRTKSKQTITANQDQKGVIQCYRQIESLFHQLRSEIILRTWNDNTKLIEAGLLKDMTPVYEALYNSDYSTTIVHRRGCSAGTSEEVLEDLKAWVGNPRGSKIYWMNGMAGTGKTTISYTLCEWLKKNNQLGANYFCSRASDLCRNISRIVPTLAYQLAEYSRSFRSMLCNILDEEPGACRADVQLQFQRLLQRPFQAMKSQMPDNVVVVIDALDECDEGSIFHLFLDTLLELAVNLPIKFFITSRPKLGIRCKTLAPNVLYLRDIEESTVSADIREHLTKALGAMYPTPSFNQVERLVKSAGERFIYATTALRYICPGKPDVGSWDRLDTVLGTAPGSTERYDDLDKLYATIIYGALYPTDKPHVEGEKNNILLVLKTVVCAKEPMSTKTLASLLSLTETQVQFSLKPLRSVLCVRENIEEPIVPFHTSFPDFLFDKSRSKEFHCEITMHNEVPASSARARTPDVMPTSAAPHLGSDNEIDHIASESGDENKADTRGKLVLKGSDSRIEHDPESVNASKKQEPEQTVEHPNEDVTSLSDPTPDPALDPHPSARTQAPDIISSPDAAETLPPMQFSLLKVKDVDGKNIDIPLYECLSWQKLCNFLVEGQVQVKKHLLSGDCVIYTPDGKVLFEQKWDDWMALAIFPSDDNTPSHIQVELRFVTPSCCTKLSEHDKDVCNHCGTPLYDVDNPPLAPPVADTMEEDVRIQSHGRTSILHPGPPFNTDTPPPMTDAIDQDDRNHSTPLPDMDNPPANPPDVIELGPIPVTNTPHIEMQQLSANDISDESRGITTAIDTFTPKNSVVRRRKQQPSSEEPGMERRSSSPPRSGNEGWDVDSQINTSHGVVHVFLTLYLYLIIPFHRVSDTKFDRNELDSHLLFLQSWILGTNACLFAGALAVLALNTALQSPMFRTFVLLAASFALFGGVFGFLLIYNINTRDSFVQWVEHRMNQRSQSRASVWDPIIMLNLPITWTAWALLNIVILILFYAWNSDPSSGPRAAKNMPGALTTLVIVWSGTYVCMIWWEISRFKVYNLDPRREKV